MYDELVPSLKNAMKMNQLRATFCQAKANEATSNFVAMSYLAEANGLLQANINIYNELKKAGISI